jgi:hypothetical protein
MFSGRTFEIPVSLQVPLGVIATLIAGVSVAQERVVNNLIVTVEAAAPSFRSAESVELRVTILNREQPCRTTYIDPVLSPAPVGPEVRPLSILELDLLDANGRSLGRKLLPVPDYTRLLPRDLLRIGCDTFHGWIVRPSRAPWGYDLRAGSYRVKARLLLTLRTFARAQDGFLDAFADHVGVSPDPSLVELLGEGVYEADESTFQIEHE